jgi:hypothetical protein
LRYGLLFLAGVLVAGASLLQGIQPNDEGLMLQAAVRIADGQVPYRDFWWFYPPGQPYLLAGLWELFGPSLLPGRVLRVALDAGVACLVAALALRHAGERAALAAWAVALLAMAWPSGPHPFPATLALCLAALLVLERRPAVAGALAGAASAGRLEFGLGLAAGAVLALALRPAPDTSRLRPPLRFAGGAVLAGAALYAPVVLAAGLAESWELLVRYPVLDFGDYQRLPFPWRYDGPLNLSSPGGFLSDSLENILVFYVPLVALLGLTIGLAGLAARRRALDATMIATAVFALVMAQYLLVRADVFHTAPLVVLVAVLGAWALHTVRPLAIASVVVLAYLAVEGADRQVRAVLIDTVPIASPVADGVRADARRDRGLNGALTFVRERTVPGEPIYVATRRSDLVTNGHPLFYVLARRPNPTRYDIQAPGVVTSAPVQREIVRDLERRRVRYVVRWTARRTAAPEPNRAGESSGVVILDRHLARRYAQAARFGPFVVLERRR